MALSPPISEERKVAYARARVKKWRIQSPIDDREKTNGNTRRRPWDSIHGRILTTTAIREEESEEEEEEKNTEEKKMERVSRIGLFDWGIWVNN